MKAGVRGTNGTGQERAVQDGAKKAISKWPGRECWWRWKGLQEDSAVSSANTQQARSPAGPRKSAHLRGPVRRRAWPHCTLRFPAINSLLFCLPKATSRPRN